jgi:uncharacterized protein (DUF1499 family)
MVRFGYNSLDYRISIVIIAIHCYFGWASNNMSTITLVAVEGFHSYIPQLSVLPPSKSSMNIYQPNIFQQPQSEQTLRINLIPRREHIPRDRRSLVEGSVKMSTIDIVSRLTAAIWWSCVMILFTTATVSTAADTISDTASITTTSSSVVVVPRIEACVSNNSNNNCVSTASVKQVDMFMLPWTWSESITVNEVVSRLKGILASDQTLSLMESTTIQDSKNNNNEYYYFRIQAARNVCTDEIEFLINSNDHVITFRSKQVNGPDTVSDFGINRRRLEDIRKALKVVTILGSTSNDGESNEGLSGQLRAFWGFQSGSGFESVLLDEDE